MALRFYNGENETTRRNLPEMATISKDGYIRISSAIVKQLPDLRRVVLAVDQETIPASIILKLVRNDHSDTYTKRLGMVRGTGLQLSARGFLRWCGIDFERTGTKQYPASYDEKTRQIIIRLVK